MEDELKLIAAMLQDLDHRLERTRSQLHRVRKLQTLRIRYRRFHNLHRQLTELIKAKNWLRDATKLP